MGITPDTKDWTWVLQRPCPECGFNAADVPAREVGTRLLAEIPTWTAALSSPSAGVRTSPDQWSVLEYGAHVRDVCVLYQERLDLMLDSDDPLFGNWDQDQTAIEERYDQQDPAVVAAELREAAEGLAGSFDALPDAAWSRPGRRSDGASFTIDTFARYFLHDVVHHGWDIR